MNDDDLYRFLNGESVARKPVSGGSTNGRIRSEYEETFYTEEKVPEPTTKYAKPFVEKLKDEVWKVSSN